MDEKAGSGCGDASGVRTHARPRTADVTWRDQGLTILYRAGACKGSAGLIMGPCWHCVMMLKTGVIHGVFITHTVRGSSSSLVILIHL